MKDFIYLVLLFTALVLLFGGLLGPMSNEDMYRSEETDLMIGY